MGIVLEVESGPGAGRRLALRRGVPVRIGRRPPAEFVLPDPRLSGLHFEVLWDGHVCRVRDLGSSNGTFIGGRRIRELEFPAGARVRAGDTFFVLRAAADRTRDSVLAVLSKSQPLFAVLDAARAPRVFELLNAASEQKQILYDGESAVHLAHCGPYLVRLPSDSLLLRSLVKEGWGESWGIYLTADVSFDHLRHHFRQFLMVETEDGKTRYFRYYDPRVLRVFLKTCDAGQHKEFMGPIQTLYADAAEPIIGVSAPRAS